MDGNGGSRTEALDHIAYLARSDHRAAVLSALRSRPYPRRDLEEETDTARTTLSRILTEFEDRGWAERTSDGTYAATPKGALVSADFERLVRSMETIDRFGTVADVLPTEELSIGVHHFSDATIHRNTNPEPAKIYDVWLSLLREADSLRMVTAVGPTKGLDEVIHDEAVAGGTAMDIVCSPDLFAHILSPETGHTPPEEVRERHEAGARLYRAASAIPCNLSLFDDRVFISNLAADTAIETSNDTVRRWATEFFDAYLADATPLTADDIPD